jgi:hypothetical protein
MEQPSGAAPGGLGPLTSPREKVPLAVTPLMPHIRCADTPLDGPSTKPEQAHQAQPVAELA